MSAPSRPSAARASSQARVRMHLRIFLVQTAWFLVLMTAVNVVFRGVGGLSWTILPAAVIMGVVMSVVLGRRQWRRPGHPRSSRR